MKLVCVKTKYDEVSFTKRYFEIQGYKISIDRTNINLEGSCNFPQTAALDVYKYVISESQTGDLWGQCTFYVMNIQILTKAD